jgi:hypothetical protein
MAIREIAVSDSREIDYLYGELSSLAVECKRRDELNDKDEL